MHGTAKYIKKMKQTDNFQFAGAVKKMAFEKGGEHIDGFHNIHSFAVWNLSRFIVQIVVTIDFIENSLNLIFPVYKADKRQLNTVIQYRIFQSPALYLLRAILCVIIILTSSCNTKLIFFR